MYAHLFVGILATLTLIKTWNVIINADPDYCVEVIRITALRITAYLIDETWGRFRALVPLSIVSWPDLPY
jgi:hypothetical protein